MRSIILSTSVFLVSLTGTAAAQATHGQEHRAGDRPPSDQALIANALSAAPASSAAGATVIGHDGRVLRQGTSDWVCLPDMPNVPNNTPMCLDAPWRAFIDALMNKRAPAVTQVGFGYMLQGDMPVSNTDPFATGPTSENHWHKYGPHLMIIVPDPKLLEGISTDPHSGGPYLMFKGTPYAHVMVPVTMVPVE